MGRSKASQPKSAYPPIPPALLELTGPDGHCRWKSFTEIAGVIQPNPQQTRFRELREQWCAEHGVQLHAFAKAVREQL